jgi:hypothetical protein
VQSGFLRTGELTNLHVLLARVCLGAQGVPLPQPACQRNARRVLQELASAPMPWARKRPETQAPWRLRPRRC